MGNIHEVAEKIEGAAHGAHGAPGGAHGHSNLGKFIGLTMAAIGVMLAICSAQVGSERTELLGKMVEQSNTYSEYQAASTKYRVMMTQIQQTYAVTPSRQLATEAFARLDQLPVPKEAEPVAALDKAMLKELLALMNPRKTEIASFLGTIQRYGEERQAAHAWAESFDDEIKAHFEGSEQFEKAQLLAEIGIVVASIALLRTSRMFWGASIVAGVLCAIVAGKEWVTLRHEVEEARHLQETAREKYEDMRGTKDAKTGVRQAEVRDAQTLAKIRERFGIAAEEAAAPEGAPAAPERH
jgi:Domain of unknown function (DUF4337)